MIIGPADASGLAEVAGEIGAGVLSGPVRSRSDPGGWQLGALDPGRWQLGALDPSE
jgi:hypothetical protein